MQPPYKPEGYTSVAPYRIVGRRTPEFLREVFGGRWNGGRNGEKEREHGQLPKGAHYWNSA